MASGPGPLFDFDPPPSRRRRCGLRHRPVPGAAEHRQGRLDLEKSPVHAPLCPPAGGPDPAGCAPGRGSCGGGHGLRGPAALWRRAVRGEDPALPGPPSQQHGLRRRNPGAAGMRRLRRADLGPAAGAEGGDYPGHGRGGLYRHLHGYRLLPLRQHHGADLPHRGPGGGAWGGHRPHQPHAV